MDDVIDDIISLESSFNDDILSFIDSGLQLPNTVSYLEVGCENFTHIYSYSFDFWFEVANQFIFHAGILYTFQNIYMLFECMLKFVLSCVLSNLF